MFVNKDFKEMLSALLEENVEFLLVGAYALSVYGHPRATGDIDLWIRNSEENAKKIWRALLKFKAPMSQIEVDDFLSSDFIFQIGVAPSRIDLITYIDGVLFEEAWLEKKYFTMDSLKIPVISKPLLIQNKEASGRPKDLADVHVLKNGD